MEVHNTVVEVLKSDYLHCSKDFISTNVFKMNALMKRRNQDKVLDRKPTKSMSQIHDERKGK